MTTVRTKIANVTGYKFAELSESPLYQWREMLLRKCKELELKGSIILAKEGINLFLAGTSTSCEVLLSLVRALPGLEGLQSQLKRSYSDHQPFTRMLVKVKREIIVFGVPEVNPARYTSPHISPRELKLWLDEGRNVTLLDTRNTFEVKLGTFVNATTLGIKDFRSFPAAVDKLKRESSLHESTDPIVTFCTGGVRCEKAAPFLEREGFRQVYQLDGGILRYFEDCGTAHFSGECFVFDKRVGVNAKLEETESELCFICQTTLTAVEAKDPRFVKGESCQFCCKK